jgi:transposase-like protein
MADDKSKKLFDMEAATNFFGLDLIKYADLARWVVSQLHPAGAKCPHCSAPLSEKEAVVARFNRLDQVRCAGCGRKFTAATNTLLNTSKLEVREIYLIAVLSHLGVSTQRIAAQLHVHPDTVTNWQGHFQAQQELASA